jgi:diguanylate cyclase (GGDEF)-like protein/PAS domain S-box-containing protein
MLIVVASILLTAIPASVALYLYTREQILDNEISKLVTVTDSQAEVARQHLLESRPKLEGLARLLQAELAKPARAAELRRFYQTMQLNPDGIWRNIRPPYNGMTESGIFLPNSPQETDAQKILHMRIKSVMDSFGSAARRHMENVWYMDPYRSIVIFDTTFPNFVFTQKADHDYTQTPWVTYTMPAANPERKFGFTPPLNDPVTNTWMVSAIYPLYLHDQWIGALGEDMQLSNVLAFMFREQQLYRDTQNFLLDAQGNFILAGNWQKSLEILKKSNQFNLTAEPALQALLKSPLEGNSRALSKGVLVGGREYVAVGVALEPMGWRYFKLVPVDVIMQPVRQLFIALVAIIFFVSIMGGMLINALVSRQVVRRISYLADAMKLYESGEKRYVSPALSGSDEIAVAAKEFDIMMDRIDQQVADLRLHANVFTNAWEGIVITDDENRILSVNQAFSKITGYTAEEIIGKNPHFLSSDQQDEDFYQALWQSIQDTGHWHGELWNRKKSGEVYAETLSISAVRDDKGNVTNYVGVFTDITDIKDAEKLLAKMEHYDALTGLPNRVLLAERLHQSCQQARDSGLLLAVCFLDIDDFKLINDKHGREAGNRLLIEVAQRLGSVVKPGDTLSRFGGDEFVILLNHLSDMDEIGRALSMINAAVAEPFVIDELEFSTSASIGLTVFPADDVDADTLIRHADLAMCEAKKTGRNRYHLFDAKLDREVQQHFRQIERIEAALANEEFCLYYQPKVNLLSGRVVGMEALIRWRHPQQGLLDPHEFLPLVEAHDLIVRIGDWVIEHALRQIRAWQVSGEKIQVSVNVAARQIQCADFIEKLERQLAAFPDVAPDLLELEILETSALETAQTADVVRTARDRLGIYFALDDFGTGYSSLSYLKQFPARTLKIDQAFVRGMLLDMENQAIVEAIVKLAKVFGHKVIAEGVQSDQHGKMLLAMGCEIVQGYGVSLPLPAGEVLDWVGYYHRSRVHRKRAIEK